jgi:hypothetical protein
MWSVLSRAWDGKLRNQDYTPPATFYVPDYLCATVLDASLKAMQTKDAHEFLFSPTYKIRMDPAKISPLEAFSTHPAGFYSFYLPDDHENLLREVTALEHDPFDAPKDDQLKPFNQLSLILPSGTTSKVTEGSMKAAADRPRCKGQFQVMSNVSASAVSGFT